MKNSIKRKVFLGFIYIHILYHAKETPIYGSWMINELQEHGYHMSPGTLYPIFHAMEEEGLLKSEHRTINGKHRKYYAITAHGKSFLSETKDKLNELINEV